RIESRASSVLIRLASTTLTDAQGERPARPDVDRTRIGDLGVSQGSAYGVILAALEGLATRAHGRASRVRANRPRAQPAAHRSRAFRRAQPFERRSVRARASPRSLGGS